MWFVRKRKKILIQKAASTSQVQKAHAGWLDHENELYWSY